jgi:photosystem II stability/assembly factor-like uncharacterized protein
MYTAGEGRETWEIAGPLLLGSTVHSVAVDQRRDPVRILAACNHWAWGRAVARSDDMGTTWEQRTPGLSFPADAEGVPNFNFDAAGDLADRGPLSVENVWALTPGLPEQPGLVWAGSQPAGLFRSDDWAESWQPVDSLNYHADRRYWYPTGGGASSLHSIEADPRDALRLYVSISSGGTYVTEDGGKTWRNCARRAIPTSPEAREMTESMAGGPFEVPEGVDPIAADEFHKFRMDPKQPDRLWGQGHVGVFRSDDRGETWEDVTKGLPSFFGFPIAVTKRHPDQVFVVPIEFKDHNSRLSLGQFTVYRTRDAGATWEPLTNGLPGPHDYQSAYRDATDTDGLSPEGVYVGTTNGELYFGREGGERWERLPGTLPPILSVRAFTTG